ncbi:uncharacterized protein VP01_3114g2 [Puccinia sorghi]|uniref:Uncharacterized protein n=1 Tax=Puccinia sorghi TaxID=27349 RepID=A0A0L6UZC5_9BASI|nr:uncharacterized protein VP01_3114g2 [Puccinia sorghi]
MQDGLQKIRNSINPCSSKTNKTNKKKAVPWGCDRVKGGESSISIILNWLSTVTHWLAGRHQSRKNQEVVVRRSPQGLKENGIYHRDVKVKSKLEVFVGTGTHLTPLWDQDQSSNLFSQVLQSLLAIKLLRIPPTGQVETCHQIHWMS